MDKTRKINGKVYEKSKLQNLILIINNNSQYFGKILEIFVNILLTDLNFYFNKGNKTVKFFYILTFSFCLQSLFKCEMNFNY